MTVVLTFVFLAHVLIYLTGTALAWRQLRRPTPRSRALPVSILKPLAGVDDGLEANLRSFFLQQHDAPFQLVFCTDDPASAAVAKTLMAEFPAIDACLVETTAGPCDNPKLANLVAGGERAKYDLLLVSDSNVRVEPGYLTMLTSHYEDDVGVVCSCITGVGAQSLGARIDGYSLNTFYVRGMFLSLFAGEPAVPGKGMLFSAQTAERFGGLRALLPYFAEDYVFGKKIQGLGLRIVATRECVPQVMGTQSVRGYVSRQIRWSQIRKIYGAPAFAFELVTMNALLPALCLMFATRSVLAAVAYLAFECACDALLSGRVSRECPKGFVSAWLLRELLAPGIWLATWTSRHITWRGRRLQIDRDGRVVPPPVDPFEHSDTGEPHFERRRLLMKKHPEIRALMGHDRRTAWVTFAVFAAHAGIAALVREWSWLPLIVISYVVGAVLSHWLGMTIHETSHNLAFKRARDNKALALFANLLMVVPIAMTFHRYHVDHHALLGVDREDTDLPTRFEARFIGNSRVRKFLWLFAYFFVYATRGLTFAKRPNRAEIFNIVLVAAANVVIVATLGWTAFLYLALSLYFAHSLHPVAAHFVHEHYIFAGKQETYSYYGALNLVTFNVGYHVEHHDFMNVPGWKLPALKALAADDYDVLVSHRSWTWLLWHFITSRRVSVASRIVRSREAFAFARATPLRQHDWAGAR